MCLAKQSAQTSVRLSGPTTWRLVQRVWYWLGVGSHEIQVKNWQLRHTLVRRANRERVSQNIKSIKITLSFLVWDHYTFRWHIRLVVSLVSIIKNKFIRHNDSLTCKCRTGSATTVLLVATAAASRGRVVGNGNGDNSCWCCLSWPNSWSRRTSSIRTEARPPPPAPWREQ